MSSEERAIEFNFQECNFKRTQTFRPMQATALIYVSHGIETLSVHVHAANTRAMGEFRFNMDDRCSFLTDKCAVVSFRRFVKSLTKNNRRDFFVVVATVDVVFFTTVNLMINLTP